MGIALGLGAALSWGLADYFAAVASRTVGTLKVVLGFHLVAMVLLAAIVVSLGALSEVAWSDVPPFILLGALGWGSYLAFYRALAIGPISIVSPVVSGYAAVTVVLAVLINGDRLSGREIAAITVAMVGVVLASSDLRQGLRTEGVAALGVLLALATTILIGSFVFGIAYYSDRLGWLAPIFLARGFTTLLLLATAARGGGRLFRGVRSRLFLSTIALLAFVDTAGYISFNFGIHHADTSIVAAASSPYAVVPIVVGVAALGERPVPLQWVGIVLVLAGLVLLGLVS